MSVVASRSDLVRPFGDLAEAASPVAVPAAARPDGHDAATRVRWALALIVLFALAARLFAILYLQAWTHPNPMEHKSIASFLVQGQGFTFRDWELTQPTSVQSPPYPLFLASLYATFGRESDAAHKAAMLVNALLGAASCGLTYLMVRRLRGTATAGLIAAALVAVWPTQVYAVTVVQAISFITCCTIAVIWLFYAAVDTRKLTPWVAYGVVGCVAAMTEPVLLPFMALSGLLILVWPGLPWAVRLRNAAVLFACAVAVMGPWTYRNWRVHGQVIPVKSTFWVNVWKANNPNATGTDRVRLTPEQQARLPGLSDAQRRDPSFDSIRQYDLLAKEQKAELAGRTEAEREAIFGRYAKTWIAENPAAYAQMVGLRLWKTVWAERDNPKGQKAYVLARTTIVLASLVGLVVAWRRGWRMAVPMMVVGVGLLTYSLTIAAARFAFPYEPWQLGLIACVLAPFASRWVDFDRGTEVPRPQVPIGAA